MRLLALLSFVLILTSPSQIRAENAFSVAVTIKPLHSLVAGVMKGAGEPALIMATGASPHHYTLRPSERRALDKASLIFWVGPDLESFMPRILKSLEPAGFSVALIDTESLLRLPARSSHEHAHEHERIDPHIWLSPDNAHAMVDAIANELSRKDAENAPLYEANRIRMHQRIDETDRHIRATLANKTAPLLSYHDAYQYFEHAYDLNNVGFVSNSDELPPGARHVRELRDRIRKQGVRCLFYEAPKRPALVDTLKLDPEMNVQELDVMGLRLEPGEDAWFEIMRGIAAAASACLQTW